MNAEKWHHSEIRIAIIDESQGSIAKNLRCDELLHNSLLHLLLKNGDFLNTDISQRSVAIRLGCGGVFVHDFVTNFLLSLTVKEF